MTQFAAKAILNVRELPHLHWYSKQSVSYIYAFDKEEDGFSGINKSVLLQMSTSWQWNDSHDHWSLVVSWLREMVKTTTP